MEFVIRHFPDPVLTRSPAAAEVSSALEQTARVLYRALPRLQAVGLAANQVGLDQSFFVHSLDELDWLVANPRVLESSPDHEYAFEGCLSLPGQRALVARPRWLVLAYDTLDGPRERKLIDWPARVVSHELDHLSGRSMLASASLVEPTHRRPPPESTDR